MMIIKQFNLLQLGSCNDEMDPRVGQKRLFFLKSKRPKILENAYLSLLKSMIFFRKNESLLLTIVLDLALTKRLILLCEQNISNIFIFDKIHVASMRALGFIWTITFS